MSPFSRPRTPRTRATSLGGALFGLFLVAPASHAAPAEDKVPLRYTAPAACVDATTFRARLDALPAAPGAAPARSDVLIITITQTDNVYTGRLHLTHIDGSATDATDRTVVSPRCDDVSDALLFVSALALGLTPAQPSRAAPLVLPVRPTAPPQAAPATPPPRARWRFRGALRGALLSSVGPNFEVGPDVTLGVIRDAPGIVAPTIELSGTWATSGSIATSDGNAAITLWSGALATCPVRFALGAGFAIRPCAAAYAGVLSGSASGASVTPAPATVVPWVAAGATLRIEWRLASFFALEAEGGAEYEFFRSYLYFSRTLDTVYRVPEFGSVSKLGVVFLWP